MPRQLLPPYDISLEAHDPSDPHSYIKLWASGYYTTIQNALRSAKTIDELKARSPNVFIFTQGLLSYAKAYGVKKDELMSMGIKTLYLGMNNLPQSSANQYIDKGFIATTSEAGIAKQFATNTGTILSFSTHAMKCSTKAIVIDESIDDIFFESEYLLLPGHIKYGSANIEDQHIVRSARYKPDKEYIRNIMTTIPPKMVQYRGGDILKTDACSEAAGKILVFWRAIKNRPVETLGVLAVPKDCAEAKAFLRANYRLAVNRFESMLSFIPEYQDLQKKNLEKYSHARMKKLWSYLTHCAVVDIKARVVETVHFRIPDALFWETNDKGREEEIKAKVLDLILP